MKSAAPASAREVVRSLLDGRSSRAPADGARAFAPSNVALCKYWGKRNAELNLPENGSLSISLGALGTQTRLAPAPSLMRHRVTLDGVVLAPESSFHRRVTAFVDLVAPEGSAPLDIETENTVPTAGGVASSASGFAALTLALDALYGYGLPARDLSILARMGSGSACRSLHRGFVLWHAGEQPDGLDSFSEPLQDQLPSLRLGLCTVGAGPKAVGSREGMMRTASTSALYRAWPEQAARDLHALRCAVTDGDFASLGRLSEQNALSMHATMIGAWPPLLYWQPASVALMQRVWALRDEGLPLYFTMDAGPHLKLLFEARDRDAVLTAFPEAQLIHPWEGPLPSANPL